MKRRLSVIAMISVALVTHALAGEDIEKAQEKLKQAREASKAALDVIREGVLEQIELKDAAERRRPNPDLNKLKVFASEKEALEKSGELPKWVDVKTRDRITRARRPLLIALGEMKAAYVRAKDDDSAAVIEKEIEEIKKGVEPRVVVGWQATFPAGQYDVVYAGGIRAITELKPDDTFSRRRGSDKTSAEGPIEFADGTLLLKGSGNFVEVWSKTGDKVKVEHWWPAAKYPAGKPDIGEATSVK